MLNRRQNAVNVYLKRKQLPPSGITVLEPHNDSSLSSKHETLTQSCFKVGPAGPELTQRWVSASTRVVIPSRLPPYPTVVLRPRTPPRRVPAFCAKSGERGVIEGPWSVNSRASVSSGGLSPYSDGVLDHHRSIVGFATHPILRPMKKNLELLLQRLLKKSNIYRLWSRFGEPYKPCYLWQFQIYFQRKMKFL